MTTNATPRVSILIPNYNNGRESSHGAMRDLIGELLQSLHDTLADEATPFEIIAYDDGSTDDSVATLREWSRRTRPDGQPFLELIEAEHCGVLARTANILSRRAAGDILARLDGDVVCLTRNWVSKLCRVFDEGPPRLGVVGPKQLREDLRIHAFGDWILHPNGYTHIAAGHDRYAVRHPMEVDHVMGCFYCCRKEVFDDLDGYDEDFLRGQTIDFGLRARLRGWQCIAVPQIEFIHHHGLRVARKTAADSGKGVVRSLRVFEDKWGFNRIAPDLDAVRRRYRGTPLLWNARWFAGDEAASQPPVSTPIHIESTEWGRYAKDPAFRTAVDYRVGVATDLAQQEPKAKTIVLVGAGCGLLGHLIALRGVSCTGLELNEARVAFARQCVSSRQYHGGPPRFEHQPDLRRLPLENGQTDLLLLFDQLECHPNPVGLLAEAHRVLGPGKTLGIISRRAAAREDCPTDHEHRYQWPQLTTQIRAVGGWDLFVDPLGDNPNRDMIALAKRLPDTPQVETATDPATRPVSAEAVGSG